MSDASGKGSSPKFWPELDLLRGFAALLMVLNHAGVEWFGGGETLPATLAIFDFGNNAPVLFFLATGVGTGLQWKPAGSPVGAHSFGLAKKVWVLLLADLVMLWGQGHPVGMDFLGFIALSMLCLEPVKRLASPLPVAVAIFMAAPLIRFGSAIAIPDPPLWLAYLTGRQAFSGFGYPLFPWLTYPFLGFILGFLAQRHRRVIERRWVALVCVGALLSLVFHLAGAALVDAGRGVHRWGSVSVAFFVFSFSVVAGLVTLALLLTRTARLAPVVRALSLRGISSLSVVPIHYAVQLGVSLIGPPPDQALPFLLGSALVCVLSFGPARVVDRWAAGLARSPRNAEASRLASVVVILAGISLWALPKDASEVRTLMFCLAQLGLCLLLALPRPRLGRGSRV